MGGGGSGKADVERGGGSGGAAQPLPQARRHRAGGDGVAALERRQPAQQVFQFADIARPVMRFQRLDRALIDRFARQAVGGGDIEEMPRQRRNVLDAVAQAGQRHRHDIEPVE